MPAVAPIAGHAVAGGCVILILGASGAGKDTLLSIAAQKLGGRDDIHFLKRVITRPAHGESEDFVSLSDAEFDAAISNGELCYYWKANDLRYGLPSEMVDRLATGQVVVVNSSRAACDDLRATFGCVKVVEVLVDPDVLAERLKRRGREDADEIAARISRAGRLSASITADLTIDNSGPPDIAGDRFARFIMEEAEALRSRA